MSTPPPGGTPSPHEQKLLDASTDSPPSVVIRDRSFDGNDFSEKVLLGARFERCTFRECNFFDADLSHVRFQDCDLYKAKFGGAVLYSCDFRECILTRADFRGAYLSGARMRDVEVTRAKFDTDLPVGKNRSSRKSTENPADGSFRVEFGEKIGKASELEGKRRGIAVAEYNRAVWFGDPKPTDQEEAERKAQERSEIARLIKRVHLEEGYVDKALEYYALERRYRREGMRPGVRRAMDLVFGHWIWGYGVGWLRAAATLVLSIVVFALAYLGVPGVSKKSGLKIEDGGFVELGGSVGSSLEQFGLAIYYAATFPIAGPADVSAVGLARGLAVVEMAWLIVVVALLVASVARRSANV